VSKIVARLTVAFAALAAVFCCSVSQSQATAGNGAWCIVTDEGDTHCNFANAQECLAAVAGTRGGFCNENSTGGSAPAATPAREKRHAR
jgi:hypothetical protein